MDYGFFVLNLIFLVVFYFFVDLVGEMNYIILIYISKKEIKSLRSLDVYIVSGRYVRMVFVSLIKLIICLMFVFFGIFDFFNSFNIYMYYLIVYYIFIKVVL